MNINKGSVMKRFIDLLMKWQHAKDGYQCLWLPTGNFKHAITEIP
jgi:hypothetical protein